VSDTIAGAAKPCSPIGVIQSVNITQQKQVTEVFELGSVRKYLLPGVVVGRATMQHIVSKTKGTLLAALYASTQTDIDLAAMATYSTRSIGLIFLDADGTPFGGAYLNGCYVESVTMGVNVQGEVVDSLSLKFDVATKITSAEAVTLTPARA